MTTNAPMRRDGQRGSAMLTAMILMAALLAGAAALVSVQMASTRSSGLVRSGINAQYCAEAGLTAARTAIAANQAEWAAALQASATAAPNPPTEPAFLSSIVHDIDGDNVADFMVYLRDNNDELPPTNDDQAVDTDLRIYVVSRCIKYPDTPREVVELVETSTGSHAYRSQEGGWNNNGNDN